LTCAASGSVRRSSVCERVSTSGRTDSIASSEDLLQREPLAPQLDQAAAHARDVQQVVDQARELLQLARHHVELVRRQCVLRRGARRRSSIELASGAQRVAQLVRRAWRGIRPCARVSWRSCRFSSAEAERDASSAVRELVRLRRRRSRAAGRFGALDLQHSAARSAAPPAAGRRPPVRPAPARAAARPAGSARRRRA
jgi:hypothetical protein